LLDAWRRLCRSLTRSAVDQVRAVMREMGESVSDADLELVLNGIDENGDGMIDYDEFSKAVTKEISESGYNLGL
jgi:Ca2+-binding EF-hand superfamily protein